MRTCTILAALFVVPQLFAAGPQRHFTDAPLRAVQFIDRNEGWAVGDDGVVWHSIDGGTSWDRQNTGVRGSLRSLCFINPYTGWVVGREELPNGVSSGIILATTDGGLKWTRICQNVLPGLHSVKFFDDKNGIVVGEGSPAFPSGVFATADGGRSWRIVAGPRQPGWLAADFSDVKTGAMAGAWSSVAILRDNVFAKAETEALGGRAVTGLRIYHDTAIAVGQGGLILKSDDTAGAKWKLAKPNCVSPEALASCDFNAVHVIGEHCWVAGRPGSFVLHSSDYGKTWEKQSTGQNLAIHGICFVDYLTGWAVGELGTILATDNGGKTWKVQHRGGERSTSERAALLMVHATDRTLPLDTIAKVGADDGYLATALRVFAPDPMSADFKRAGEPDRWCDAVRIAGGASGECLWPFALGSHHSDDDAKSILASLDAQLGNRAGEILLRELVLAIRIWRPEVIISDAPNDGATTVVHEAMKKAFELAANAKAFPEQIDELGLKPWSAKKLYAPSPRSNDASLVTISTIDPLPRIGDSARDMAQSAAMILRHPSPSPNERCYRLLAGRLPGVDRDGALMQGITLAHGGQARRDQPSVTPTEIEALNERIQFARIRRNIEALATGDLKGIGGPDKLLAQLDAMLKKLPADLGGQAAFNVADSFARNGQWPLAREAYMLMLERFPAHPLAIDACRWLIRYHSSSEARRRFELRQFVVNSNYQVQHANVEGPKEGVIRQTTRNESVKTEQRTPLATPEVQQWYKPALALESKLAANGPLFLRDPEFQLCLQSARRSLGDPMAMKKWCERFAPAGAAHRDAWCDIAAMETWLNDRSKKPPRPVGACRFTPKRPHLDGLLDDPCWTDAEPLPLQRPSSDLHDSWAAQAYFAHDNEFLYIAVKCKHPVGRQVAKVEKRTRDMDLHQFDRVAIMLDVDRDYQTYYHLQIDQRGALCEDCWGDKTWNPKWYVAVNSDANGWTAEVAIPMAELSGETAAVGKTWACNVVRVIPGKGVMSWSRPADVEPRPEGMGLLMFTEQKK